MDSKDVMTPNPACCTRDASLREVARMLVEHDCEAIPVVDGRLRACRSESSCHGRRRAA